MSNIIPAESFADMIWKLNAETMTAHSSTFLDLPLSSMYFV